MKNKPAIIDQDEAAERFSSRSLAEEIGIGALALEEFLIGQCVRGTDYTRTAMGVLVTSSGREKILSAFTPMPPRLPSPAPLPEPCTLLREDLRITRTGLGDRRLLAERSNGNEVVLSVKSTRWLRPGLMLRDCVQEIGNAWSYYGRLPQRAGEVQLFVQP